MTSYLRSIFGGHPNHPTTTPTPILQTTTTSSQSQRSKSHSHSHSVPTINDATTTYIYSNPSATSTLSYLHVPTPAHCSCLWWTLPGRTQGPAGCTHKDPLLSPIIRGTAVAVTCPQPVSTHALLSPKTRFSFRYPSLPTEALLNLHATTQRSINMHPLLANTQLHSALSWTAPRTWLCPHIPRPACH